MNLDPAPQAEYVEARRVLLDALETLGPQRNAVIVAGAQAIYIRTGPGELAVADFTTDGDLALDPDLLVDTPTLSELMEAAGFSLAQLQGSPEPGIWEKPATINGVQVRIPVDLIVPTGFAHPAGTRGARLGVHGNRAARKTTGMEAALIDYDRLAIEALTPADERSFEIKVAGAAAMLVAKTHKLKDRAGSNRNDRLSDKDASDVVRLMVAKPAAETAKVLAMLCEHPLAGPPTRAALEDFHTLFGDRSGQGIWMASRALRQAMPVERIRAICLTYAGELAEAIDT